MRAGHASGAEWITNRAPLVVRYLTGLYSGFQTLVRGAATPRGR